MLGGAETLDICVIGDAPAPSATKQGTDAGGHNRFQYIDRETAAKKCKWDHENLPSNFEVVYIDAVLRKRQKNSYASDEHVRYVRMNRIRRALSAGAVVAAAACSVVAAILFADAWLLNDKSESIDRQVAQLSATFRRENELFSPIKADSHEMKMAVDAGDYILQNRVPVPWVFNQLGAVLGDYPDIELRELRWSVESAAPTSPPQRRRGERAMPIPIPKVDAVSAVFSAELVDFDGNLRNAFTRIDAFAAEIRQRTAFTDARAIEYPFEANTGLAVSGEIDHSKTSDPAHFELRVTYQLPDSVIAIDGEQDDAV